MRPDSTFEFEFARIDNRYENYYGTNVRLRHIVRATIALRIGSISKEYDIIMQLQGAAPPISTPVKRELRIEGALLIDFECEKSQYHLEDVIVGKIVFRMVRVMIKRMEISIIRTEKIIPAKRVCESETMKRYEIVYGYPASGTVAPIRLHLKHANLTPSYHEVNKKFSASYSMCVILVDEQNRRYSRKQEIELLRCPRK